METKEIIMLVVIGLLVIIAATQTIQLVSLKGSTVSMNMPMTSSKQSTGMSSQTSSASSLDDLPEMVGGC
jgi:hypothetical protein